MIKNLHAWVTGALIGNTDRLDEIRIFITNGALSQVVHRVDPWSYPLGSPPVVLPFNISDAEESSVAASITDDFVEFTVAFYADNGAVGTPQTYRMPINPAFQAPATGWWWGRRWG